MTEQASLDAIRQSLQRLGSVALGPVLSEADLAAFEALNRIRLPGGYRRFLLEFGNGGDGPGEGLAPLEPTRVIESLELPFPLERAWVWDEDPRADEEAISACHNGWLELGTEGCGMDWALIVTGEQRGSVWNVEDQGAQPCLPSRAFLEWYLLWLRWLEAGGEDGEDDWWEVVWSVER